MTATDQEVAELARWYSGGLLSTDPYHLGATRLERFNGTARGVMLCHGVTAGAAIIGLNASDSDNSDARTLIMDEVLRAGYMLISSAHEDGTLTPVSATWGNDTARTKANTAANALEGFGALPAKFAVIGESMGGITGFGVARVTAATCVGIVGLVPACDLEYMRVSSGFAAVFGPQIEAAYGGLSGYNSAKATHDPVLFAAASADVPFRAFTHSNDLITGPTQTQTLCDVLTDGLIIDQGPGPTAGFKFGHSCEDIDPAAVVDALDSFDWST